MDQLYHQTNRILKEIEKNFQQLVNYTQDPTAIENEIHMKITTVNSNCDRLDVLLYKVPASQRPASKMRVDQIKYDIRHLQNSLDMYHQKKQRKQIEINEREQLLNHRFTANSETCLDIDYGLQHNNSLNNAHQGVDEMIFSGSNILSSLMNQRETIKGAQRRIINIGNTLGLSNHTMKLIERRFTEDKYVLVGGMFVTLLVIAFVLYFFVF